jgi:hypothetical protein
VKRVIIAESRRSLLEKLVPLIGAVDSAAFSCELILAKGCIVVAPEAGYGEFFSAGGPRHWETLHPAGERRVALDGGRELEVSSVLPGLGVLELVAFSGEPWAACPEQLGRVVFRVTGEQHLGHLVRALLVRGSEQLRFLRLQGEAEPSEYLLLSSGASLYVVLEAQEELGAAVFYEQVQPGLADEESGYFVPWGMQLPLLSRLRARRHRPVLMTMPRALEFDIGAMLDVHAAVEPRLAFEAARLVSSDPGAFKIDVPLRLERTANAPSAELWWLKPQHIEVLKDALYGNEEATAGLEAFVALLPESSGVVEPQLFLWDPRGKGELGARLTHAGEVAAFVRSGTETPTLLIPFGTKLTPRLRPKTLQPFFGLSESSLTLLVPNASGVRVLHLALAAMVSFRQALVEYTLSRHREQLEALCGRAEFDFGEPEVEAVTTARAMLPAAEAESPLLALEQRTGEATLLSNTGVLAPETAEQGPRLDPRLSPSIQSGPSNVPPPRVALPDVEPSAEPMLDEAAGTGLTGLARRFLEQFASLTARDWCEYASQAKLEGRSRDQYMAILRSLDELPRDQAKDLLGLHLMLESKDAVNRACERFAEWARTQGRDESWLGLADHVLTIYLLACRRNGQLKDGAQRTAVETLASCLEAQQSPRLAWHLARAAAALLEDRQFAERQRLEFQRQLTTLTLDACVPPALLDLLQVGLVSGNRARVEAWLDSLPATLSAWTRGAFFVELCRVGIAPSEGELARWSLEIDAAGKTHGDSTGRELAPWREWVATLARQPALPPESWSKVLGSNPDPGLRALLAEEGFLRSQREAMLSPIAQLLWESDAEIALRLPAALESAMSRPELLAQLPQLVATLGRRGCVAALDELALRTVELGAIAAADASAPWVLRVVDFALDVWRDQGEPDAEQVTMLGHGLNAVFVVDRPRVALSWVASLSALPHALRCNTIPDVTRLLFEAGALPALEAPRAPTLQERRLLWALLRLVLLRADETPDAQRILNHESHQLRALLRRDYAAVIEGRPL